MFVAVKHTRVILTRNRPESLLPRATTYRRCRCRCFNQRLPVSSWSPPPLPHAAQVISTNGKRPLEHLQSKHRGDPHLLITPHSRPASLLSPSDPLTRHQHLGAKQAGSCCSCPPRLQYPSPQVSNKTGIQAKTRAAPPRSRPSTAASGHRRAQRGAGDGGVTALRSSLAHAQLQRDLQPRAGFLGAAGETL